MKFKKLIENKSVAVVGNSQSLFNKEYGKFIDYHDIVIRFNKPAILYSNNVNNVEISHGTKMDVWAFWTISAFYNKVLMKEANMQRIKNEFFNNKNITKIQAVNNNNYRELTNKYISDSYSNYRFKDLKKKLIECRCWQSSQQRQREFNLLNDDDMQPSTGLVILDWILSSNSKEVNIFGMDFKRTPTFSEHSMHKKDMIGKIDARCNHNFSLEELYIRTLILSNPKFKLRV